VADDTKADTDAMIPLAEEQLAIGRRLVETGHVRLHLSTATENVLLRETLRGERMEVERVTLGHEVTAAPAVREEEDGAVLVVPVLEETLVVERRLVLKEELRIRRVAMNEIVEKAITLRRQVARVERLSAAAPQAGPDPQGRRDDGTGDPA
jgi:uncharacterized protein (TIGR02271 family)